MGRLQTIENKLSEINPTVFQELCDSFLVLRNKNYSAFSRTGSQKGKQKTTKGTPDTFLLLPNGQYVFVEYSTNISEGISKLVDDITKCINPSKTGISIKDIAEIIICINFSLKAKEIQELKKTLGKSSIQFSLYTLDSLAIEIHLNHRDLAHQYLGLPLDTGQIVSIEKFISEYNRAAKGIATPLDNTFLFREQELQELKSLVQLNDFIILTGAPGIGKTKLSLEIIKQYLNEDSSFIAYCISYKNYTLLDDLFQYFTPEKNYLLLVDDANRIDAFNQITGFYKAIRTGTLKILITVRDYAYQDIEILCHDYSPKRFVLEKFTDEQITAIVKAQPFKILNSEYHRPILRIADGNPRLAIMTALLAIEKQNIYALNDVSELFEKYFSTFIKDNDLFAEKNTLKYLGLIAFFHSIPFKSKELTTSILNDFELDYSQFIDLIDKLERLELVEVQFDYVKIPEQNLSAYFFYKSFVKEGLLSFSTLLAHYFDNEAKRFKDCIVPVNNTFGYKNVISKLLPFLRKYWHQIKNSEEKGFKFLSIFWYYLPIESFEFIFKLIEELPDIENSDYYVKYKNNAFSYNQNRIVELLGEFFRYSNNLKDSLELAFEYVRKKPKHLPELIHKIRAFLTFDKEDERLKFARQNTLFGLLAKGFHENDLLYINTYYELAKTFLAFQFQQSKSGRNFTITVYNYHIPNNVQIQKFRKQIWDIVDKNFKNHPTLSFDFLKSYARINPDVCKEIMEFDVSFLLNIVENHLDMNLFEHCRYVQNQIMWCKKNEVFHPRFSSLSKKFRNPTYETFLIIDWDRYRDKELYDFDDYKAYEKLKEIEVRKQLVFTNKKELSSFYSTFIYLKNLAKNDWMYNTVLDFVLDENCSLNFDLGCHLFVEIIENDNQTNFIPNVVFKNHLKTPDRIASLWDIVQHRNFQSKEDWEFSFYYHLGEKFLSKKYAEAIITTVNFIRKPFLIRPHIIARFLNIKPNLAQIILKIILKKNKIENVKLQIWGDVFTDYFDNLGDDFSIIGETYIQQEKLQQYFDYDKKGLLKILQKKPEFLLEYIKNLYSSEKPRLNNREENKNLGIVWQVDNIEPILKETFDFIVSKSLFLGILEHFCNAFFTNLSDYTKDKAKLFLFDYVKENYANSDKMNVVLDITRYSLKDIYEDVLLLFITLCQDKDVFSKIQWQNNGGVVWGDVIIGDIKAAKWQDILAIVNKSDLGFKLIPIKKFIQEQIAFNLRSGDWERKRRFLRSEY